jgi:hypothetical protein
MPVWLTDKQLKKLTRRKRPSAQALILRDAGIPYSMVDGRPTVVSDQIVPRAIKAKPKLVM